MTRGLALARESVSSVNYSPSRWWGKGEAGKQVQEAWVHHSTPFPLSDEDNWSEESTAGIEPCYSKYGPQASSTSITWGGGVLETQKLRNQPRPTESDLQFNEMPR